MSLCDLFLQGYVALKVRLDVITAFGVKIAAFLDVRPCCLQERNRRP